MPPPLAAASSFAPALLAAVSRGGAAEKLNCMPPPPAAPAPKVGFVARSCRFARCTRTRPGPYSSRRTHRTPKRQAAANLSSKLPQPWPPEPAASPGRRLRCAGRWPRRPPAAPRQRPTQRTSRRNYHGRWCRRHPRSAAHRCAHAPFAVRGAELLEQSRETALRDSFAYTRS